MTIEHFAFQVPDPAAAASWYVEHLGMSVARSVEEPAPTRFLADRAGRVMIEIYRNPSAPLPDYEAMDPLVMHLAFSCDDVDAERDRLVDAGARVARDAETTPHGDRVAMLRDPWGVPIQLCRRAAALV